MKVYLAVEWVGNEMRINKVFSTKNGADTYNYKKEGRGDDPGVLGLLEFSVHGVRDLGKKKTLHYNAAKEADDQLNQGYW